MGLDPNLKAPYSHEASVFVERQLTDTMGVRAGFVYKTADDLISTYQKSRGLETYTVPYTFVDIGVDGIRGTGDDKNLQFFGFPTSNTATNASTVTNVDQYSRYKTVEASVNKRYGNKWSASMGGGYTWTHDFPNDYPQNPMQPGVDDRTGWGFKASGSYDAPWGLRLTPILRHQSGVNYARTITISVPAGSAFSASGTHYVEPSNSNREDNILVVDVRAEKTLNISQPGSDSRVFGCVQLVQQPRLGDDRARDRSPVPEARADPCSAHGPARLPVYLLAGSTGFCRPVRH